MNVSFNSIVDYHGGGEIMGDGGGLTIFQFYSRLSRWQKMNKLIHIQLTFQFYSRLSCTVVYGWYPSCAFLSIL